MIRRWLRKRLVRAIIRTINDNTLGYTVMGFHDNGQKLGLLSDAYHHEKEGVIRLYFVNDPTSIGPDPRPGDQYCYKCDTDTHWCIECGTTIPHGEVNVCEQCF